MKQKSTNMIFTEKLYPRITNKVQKPTQVTTQMCCPDGSYKTYVITKSRPSAYVFVLFFVQMKTATSCLTWFQPFHKKLLSHTAFLSMDDVDVFLHDNPFMFYNYKD